MISRKDIKKLSKEDCVRLALKAANLVSHLSDDPRVMDAIEAAEDWLANPSEDSAEAAYAAAYGAYIAANAASAAWAAYTTAAWAADAAACAADAAAEAALAAADAWTARTADSAVYAAIKADPNTKLILVKYLEELLAKRGGDD